MSDSVAVDAKRILLRYGAPINLLDGVSDEDRIALARDIAKTDLASTATESGVLQVPALRESLDHPRDGSGLYVEGPGQRARRSGLLSFRERVDGLQVVFNGASESRAGGVVHL